MLCYAAKFFWYLFFMFIILFFFTCYGMTVVAVVPNIQVGPCFQCSHCRLLSTLALHSCLIASTELKFTGMLCIGLKATEAKIGLFASML